MLKTDFNLLLKPTCNWAGTTQEPFCNPFTLWPCKYSNLSIRNFKTGTATEKYNTPLERPLLELCNELSLDAVECSVLPLDGAKHSALFFLN